MDAYVLDFEFDVIDIIDDYTSLIWTERYNECGDFEIVVPPSTEYVTYAANGYYLSLQDTKRLMIMESYELANDIENGPSLTISGRSLESILDRRIVWSQTKLNGKLQNGIKKLLNDAFINPSIKERKLSNFIFKNADGTSIEEMTIKKQFTGDNLYEVVAGVCQVYGIGFKIEKDERNRLVFSLYDGANLTDSVIFSPEFDNLLSSNYTSGMSTYKNVALVAGEDSAQNRKTKVVKIDTSATGLGRRELYVDARDIQTEGENGEEPLTEEEYSDLLELRGYENLVECQMESVLEGEADLYHSFYFNKDYFLGDIVSIENEYGLALFARVSEVVRSFSGDEGYVALPSFAVYTEPGYLEEEDDPVATTTGEEETASAGYEKTVTASRSPRDKDSDLNGEYVTSIAAEIRNYPGVKAKSLIKVPKDSTITCDGRYTLVGSTVWYYVKYSSNAGNDGTILYVGFMNSSQIKNASAKNKNLGLIE